MSDKSELDGMTVIVDTREQTPWEFPGVKVQVHKLDQGDYSVLGLEGTIAIERKSLADLTSTLAQGRERFQAELVRLESVEHAMVIVEAAISQVMAHTYVSRISPQSVIGSCVAFQIRHGVAFHWCESRAQARNLAFAFLRRVYLDHQVELALRTPTEPQEPRK